MRDYNKEYRDTSERKYSYDFDSRMRRYMMRSFEAYAPRGRALEMGCYQGEFTALLAQRFDDLTVIEASDELVAQARQRTGDRVRFVCSTFEAFETGERWDSIFLVHTLEHLDDPVGVLRRVNCWLSAAGQLFLAVPNANAPSRQIAVKMGLIENNAAVTAAERAHGHRITYSLDTVERDARAAGLEVVHRGGVLFKPLANFQFDRLAGTDILSEEYLEGCYQLGMVYPDLCASVYLVCRKGPQ